MNKEMAGVRGELQPQLQRAYRLQDFATPGVIMRERSFVRPQSHHNMHHHPFPVAGKRRSMIMTNAKGKPTLEIYRPPDGSPAAAGGTAAASNGQPAASSGQLATAAAPAQNKLNVHAKEFTMSKPSEMHTPRAAMAMGYGGSGAALQHSRSSAVLHSGQAMPQHFRPLQPMQPLPLPLVTSASTSSIMHMGSPRVHFKMPHQSLTPEKKRSPTHNGNGKTPIRAQALGPGGMGPAGGMGPGVAVGLKRSKSMTTTDALASGMAGLGLSADAGDLGAFPPEVQDCIDKALQDPNSVCSRTLMEACGHLVSRAVESVRYALPAARRCIAVVEREHTETFLESLLNTCQQWYHDRDKLLNQVTNGGRPRLMAFLSFLLEMYCQVRRRAIQRRAPANQSSACQPALLLLTLICKCCEDCIRQPVPSAGDTENLFFVLTYIGRDLETRLPGELERLLAGVRDAFLNLGTSAHPSIRKTLLQLIELHASRWNLPGCAVLYYYPSTK